MSKSSMGKIVVIIGPSGTGKSTLLERLKSDVPSLVESISYTTRPIRESETDGVHYFFISKEKFMTMVDNNEFLEWFEVHGDYKGTGKKFVQKSLEAGTNLLFDLDVQGADALKAAFPDDAKAIFIAPPSLEELEKRLRNRGTESSKSLEIRLENSKKEILRKDDYDYCVINDELERAYLDLKSAVLDILGQ